MPLVKHATFIKRNIHDDIKVSLNDHESCPIEAGLGFLPPRNQNCK